MKILCVVGELWLVELTVNGGEVSYWCERCHQDAIKALAAKSNPLFVSAFEILCRKPVILRDEEFIAKAAPA